MQRASPTHAPSKTSDKPSAVSGVHHETATSNRRREANSAFATGVAYAGNAVDRPESDPPPPRQRGMWSFSGIPLHSPVQGAGARRGGAIQAKTLIGETDDPLEREADLVADQVMGARERPSTSVAEPPPQISRKSSGAAAPGEAPASAEGVLNTSGVPLGDDVRAFMEPRFGRDFSDVRVHTDDAAARSARDVDALAYTLGAHMVFGAGRFAPQTSQGRRLIAHELTHVAQQTGAEGRVIRREPGAGDRPEPATFFLPSSENLLSDRLWDKLKREGLLPAHAGGMILAAGGYYVTDKFAQHTLLVIVEVKEKTADGEIFKGYTITDYTRSAKPPPQPPAGSQAAVGAGRPAQTPPHKAPKAASAPTPSATPAPKTAPEAAAKTPEQIQAEIGALPAAILDLLKAGGDIAPQNMQQVLRIAEKLKRLQPEDLAMYKLLAKDLAKDLDAFERSVDHFIAFKAQITAQAGAEAKADAAKKEPTLEQEIAGSWSTFDDSKFSGMSAAEKEQAARNFAAKQRDIQLKHMASHPGETAVGMAKGMVRLDKAAQSIADDVAEAADGNKGAYARLAAGVGATNKFIATVASIVFVALLFVPGVNLAELALAGLAVASAGIVLSVTESELRIKAASEASTTDEFKTQTTKAAAAQAQAVMSAALLALTLAAKLIAKIPLPGRYQNVGAALKAAQGALLEKSGVGPAWQTLKIDLASKLRASKQGLVEALAEQAKIFAKTKSRVESLSSQEMVQQLANGDPELAELGIPPEEASGIQKLGGSPEGQKAADQLRQDVLKALDDAPVEAGKKVDAFIKAVDDTANAVDQAKDETQFKAAVAAGEDQLGEAGQAKKAVADEQDFVKRRTTSVRKSAVREQAKTELDALQGKKAATAAKIRELEGELSEASIKVNQLKAKVQSLPREAPERAAAMAEFKQAQQALKDLQEADELGGYRDERRQQGADEERILESLELDRPALRQATKDAIKAAGKRNAAGQYLDANTGEPINGEPVYGHKYGREHRRLVLEAAEKGLDQEQFNKWVNDHPEWFQLETKANNESHRFEKPGVD